MSALAAQLITQPVKLAQITLGIVAGLPLLKCLLSRTLFVLQSLTSVSEGLNLASTELTSGVYQERL